MRVGNSKTALFLGAVGRKILVPFFLVRKVRRRLLGFGVPPPPPLSFHPQELSWDPREQGWKGELGAGTTLLRLWAWPCRGHECWVTEVRRQAAFMPHWVTFYWRVLEVGGGHSPLRR